MPRAACARRCMRRRGVDPAQRGQTERLRPATYQLIRSARIVNTFVDQRRFGSGRADNPSLTRDSAAIRAQMDAVAEAAIHEASRKKHSAAAHEAFLKAGDVARAIIAALTSNELKS